MKGHPTKEIQSWFSAHCDGAWEHEYGLKIETIDNPGWSLEVDLRETEAEAKSFEEVQYSKSEQDWVRCSVRDKRFEGFGGPFNLEDLLKIFLKWVSS